MYLISLNMIDCCILFWVGKVSSFFEICVGSFILVMSGFCDVSSFTLCCGKIMGPDFLNHWYAGWS